MAIKMAVAVTNRGWFDYLSRQPDLQEVNFWSPTPQNFQALQPGELLLFKVKKTEMIGGYGVFAFFEKMPLSLAWEAFGTANGAPTLAILQKRILESRDLPPDTRPTFDIGCRILTQPVFWSEAHWLPVPPSWSQNIMKFKTYGADTTEGLALWEAVQERGAALGPALGLAAKPAARYGEPTLIRPRLGQGGFRMLVTGLYERKCAVTRERTLPALEAAHIRPYNEGGEHVASNGILLRRDIHSLFDAGYVTVTPRHAFEVSRRIKEEFENGREYYALHGRAVKVPERPDRQPDAAMLRWHNEERFLG